MEPIAEPLSIRQLEVFVTLIEQGSFTKAARHLGLSQSTVSGHIADLERRLGARVVERGRRRATVTAAGEALLPPARETLAAERSTRRAVEELSGLRRGRLVVGASTIPATYLLPGLLARFHQEHPDIALRVLAGDSREVVRHVRAADVELGIVGERPPAEEFEAEVAGRDRLVLVVAPGHPLAGKGPVPVAEVMRHPIVMREEGSGTRAATLDALREAGGLKDADDLDVACEMGSTESLKSAVQAGLGTAFVSDLAVGSELRHGALVQVEVQGVDVARELHLIHRRGAFVGPAARAFRKLALAAP